eukprot:jgi/Hompol1/6079/HPOL_002211-RA
MAATFKSPLPEVVIPEIDAANFVLGSAKFQENLDKVAMIDALRGDKITFGELHRNAHRFASGLINDLGLQKWEVVAIYSHNDVHYSTIVFGTLLAGGTITTANNSYTVEELVYQLKDSSATTLVVAKDCLANGKAAAEQAGIAADRVFVLARDAVDGVQSVFDLFSEKEFTRVEFTADELVNQPAYLTYSSGTTGRSKGVQTSHRNMVANVIQTDVFLGDNLVESDIWLGFLPFFHMYALNVSLHLATSNGIPVVVMPIFDFLLLLKTIQTHKLATLFIVPPIALALARHPIVARFDVSSVKRIISGAAPFSAEISKALSDRFNAAVVQGYGLTETSPIISLNAPKTPIHGSIGVLAPNMEARIVDPETGADLSYGEPGELWVRGPNVMKAYHNNPEATAEAIDADGYFHTGDVAIITDDGQITIVDRLKELIKFSGLQVPPAELEAKLLAYPKIADAAVIGIPDEATGEVPIAYVVLHPGQTATEDEIKEFIKARVAPHKQLRGGVIFTDSIPKAASGKILRRILRTKDAERRHALEQAAETQ